jgi:two-component system sensor histidine kinase KdpD
VRETLPDAVFERADDIELIDLTPDELVERLHEGKVYLPAQAERALQSFFQKANLTALREISLRTTADRLNEDVQVARRGLAKAGVWPTNERLLVCVGPSPTSAKVIRSAKRLAADMRCEWIAVSVETSKAQRMGPANRARLVQNLHLAEQLGAETVSLSGENAAEEIIAYARERNVTKIVVGKTDEPRWKRLWRGTFVDELLRHSGEIDVYVVRGLGHAPQVVHMPESAPFSWWPYLWAVVTVATCTALAWPTHWFGLDLANVVMIFLLGVLFVAARFGRGPGILASLLGVLAFDVFFVPPYFRLAVSDTQYVITFAVMLAISLVISALTARIREQVQAAIGRERRTESLHRLSRQLAGAAGTDFLAGMAGRQIAEIFGGETAVYLPEAGGRVEPRWGQKASFVGEEKSAAVAQWVFEHDEAAGAGTETLPNAPALFLPLGGSEGPVGVLAIKPADIDRLRTPDQRRLLEACASQIALALERDRLALEAHEARAEAEADRLRSVLLSSVSHDLRTPLAVISGASSSLLSLEEGASPETRSELLQTIYEEAHRLARLVDNLIDMMRLDAGAVHVKKEWHVLEEVVGSALRRTTTQIAGHPVELSIPADLPLAPLDAVLIEQVLINLLENAAKYTPDNTPIGISARFQRNQVIVEVADRGPGIPEGDEERVFEKFYRGPAATTGERRGAGLGLAICRAILTAHGGTIKAENRPGGGARFWFSLPIVGTPPKVAAEEPAEPAMAS